MEKFVRGFPSHDKQTIQITTLQDALNYAEQDIKDRWEFYKERYLKKFKKWLKKK